MTDITTPIAEDLLVNEIYSEPTIPAFDEQDDAYPPAPDLPRYIEEVCWRPAESVDVLENIIIREDDEPAVENFIILDMAPNSNLDYRVSEALNYLGDVKGIFSEQPEVYEQFRNVLKDWRLEEIDSIVLLERVSELFRGHPSLIHGFKVFVPDSILNVFEASQRDEESQFPAFDIADALGYLDLVKKEFTNEPDVYRRFLDVMTAFKDNDIDLESTVERVLELFHDHTVLLQRFDVFLPVGDRIEL